MRSAVLLLLIAGVAYSLVVGYHVEPVSAQLSGWTPRDSAVAQVITINFDELDSTTGAYCELFAGTKGAGGAYHLSVLTYPGGSQITEVANANGAVDHEWVRFRLQVTRPESVVKGKKLEFRFTRSGNDSIQYYYAENAYDYGHIVIGGGQLQQPPGTAPDLCMRVYGRMKAVDSTYWGFVWVYPGEGTSRKATVAAKAETAGVGFDRRELLWKDMQPDSQAMFDFEAMDSAVSFSHDRLGCEVIGLLDYATNWAGTHAVAVSDTDTIWSPYSPPVNLYADVSSDTNYWGVYVQNTVQHFGSRIRTYECWNEPNHMDRFWQMPHRQYSIDTTARKRCSLYVQLCWVAAQVIKAASDTNLVLVGAMSQVTASVPSIGLVAGKDWLRMFYDIAKKMGYGGFWDGVSIHPYQVTGLDVGKFEADAETLRAIMRANNDYGGLWITEVGWWPNNRELQANYMGGVITAAKASETNPAGGYDQMCWYSFLDMDGGGILTPSPDYSCRPAAYASGQTRNMLIGKRFNGRVMRGDTAIDKYTWVYEFEDTTALKNRTWVCWQDEVVSTYTPVPVRSDTLDTVALAYDESPPTGQKDAENSGWLHVALQPRPRFVTEKTAISRPDMVVDSFRVWPDTPKVGQEIVFTIYVSNRGNRATSDSIWYRLLCDTAAFINPVWTGIDSGASDIVRLDHLIVQPEWLGQHLFSVQVNPGQWFVEKDGLDDNGGYSRKVVLTE